MSTKVAFSEGQFFGNQIESEFVSPYVTWHLWIFLALTAAGSGLLIWNIRLRRILGLKESSLIQSENRFRAVVQNATDVTQLLDAKGKFLYVSPSVEKLLGLRPEEMIGKNRGDFHLVSPETSAQAAENFKKLAASPGAVIRFTMEMRHRDGGHKQVEFTASNRLEDPALGAIVVNYRDVTDRIQAEENLKSSLKENIDLRAALDEHAIVATTDPRGKITFVNEKFCAISQYSREELIGQDHRIINSGHHSKKFFEDLWRTISKGGVWNGEIKNRAKDGSFYWVATTIVPFVHEDGSPRQFVAIRADISNRKRAEECLAESESRLNLIYNTTVNPMFLARRDGPEDYFYESCNDAYLKFANEAAFGGEKVLTRETITGVKLGTFSEKDGDKPSAEARNFISLFEKSFAGRETISFQSRVRGKSGLRVLWISVAPLFDENGNPKNILYTSVDLTDRVLAEEALRESEERFRLMANASPVLIWVSGTDKKCTYFNNRWLDFTGRRLEEEMGDGWVQGVHQDDLARCLETYSGSFDAREEFSMEYRLRHRDGSHRWILDKGVPRFIAGEFVGYIGSCVDIEEMKVAQNEISHMNEILEKRVAERTRELTEVNRELESFAYSVSHDLRAPLRSIVGFSKILQEGQAHRLDETGKSHLFRINRAAGHMGLLIDSLLKLSRLTRAPLNRVRVNLTEKAEKIFQDLRSQNPGRRAECTVEPDLFVSGDAVFLQSVMENLLGNAWKFSGKAPVSKIQVGQIVVGGKKIIFVEDNGDGFDMAYGDKLFGAFQRLHSQEEFPGTGVGLATVQRLIHRHHGWIRAEGRVGHGARFEFYLPEADPEQQESV